MSAAQQPRAQMACMGNIRSQPFGPLFSSMMSDAAQIRSNLGGVQHGCLQKRRAPYDPHMRYTTSRSGKIGMRLLEGSGTQAPMQHLPIS